MEKLLKQSTLMFCDRASTPVPFRIVRTLSEKCDEGNEEILTTANSSVVGISCLCQLLPPVPVGANLCKFVFTGWHNADSQFCVNGAKVLTEDSYVRCPFGGKLTPRGVIAKSCIASDLSIDKGRDE